MKFNDKNLIIQRGIDDFNDGKSNLECPFSYRTAANLVCLWNQGWDKGNNTTCKGKNCTAKNGIGHSQEFCNEH